MRCLQMTRTPLIISVAIAGKISPPVTAINDGLFFCTFQSIEKTGLCNVTVVFLCPGHLQHAVCGRIRVIDTIGFEVVYIGGIPSIKIGCTDIILSFVFEHTVSFSA